MGLRWQSILGFHAMCKTLFDMSSISKNKNRQGCFRTHFHRVGPNPRLVLFALTAVHNSKMFFLGATNADKQFNLRNWFHFTVCWRTAAPGYAASDQSGLGSMGLGIWGDEPELHSKQKCSNEFWAHYWLNSFDWSLVMATRVRACSPVFQWSRMNVRNLICIFGFMERVIGFRKVENGVPASPLPSISKSSEIVSEMMVVMFSSSTFGMFN